jgi:TPR repeat protein
MRTRVQALFLGAAGAFLVAAGAAAEAQSPAERCAAAAPRGDFRTCAAAVEAAPGDAGLRRFYAQSLAKAADYEGSIGQYREVTRLTPADARAFYEYAWMLAFVRRYAEAVEPIETSIRLRPDHVESYRAATIIYQIIKRPDDEFRVALGGARLGDPISMFDVHACFAAGRGTQRDEAQALHWLERAAEAGHVTAMDKLAAIFLNGGFGRAPDETKAEEWATRARLARAGRL